MSCNFVVEGTFDQMVVERALRSVGRTPGRVVVAGGLHRLVPLAMSMLARWPEPLVLLADADTTDADAIEVRRHELTAELGWVNGAPPFRVVLAVPEIEAVFFDEDASSEYWIERVLGVALSPRDRIEAHFAPKRVLHRLARDLGVSLPALIERFDVDVWRQAAKHPCALEILNSMDDMSPETPAAALG